MSQTILEAPTVINATFAYYDGPSPADASAGDPVKSTVQHTNLQTLPVEDIKPTLSLPKSTFTLDVNGFNVVKHSSALSSQPYDRSSWNDENLLEEVYYPEIEDIVKKVTGARKVMIHLSVARTIPFKEPQPPPSVQAPNFTAYQSMQKLVRPAVIADKPRILGLEKGMELGPLRKPHIDWGNAAGARATLRNWRQDIVDEAQDIIRDEDAALALPGGIPANYKGRRWGIYGTWRPVKPITRDPLAVMDFQSLDDEDLVSLPRKGIPGIHGTFDMDVKLAKASPTRKHRWYWCRDQQPDELTVLKFFDSEHELEGSDVAGGIPHCSFHLPGSEDEPQREIIETKVFVFW